MKGLIEYAGINEIWEKLTSTNTINTYIQNASEEQVLGMISAIFEQGLVGTCLYTPETILQEFGIDVEALYKKIDESKAMGALDDIGFECESCNWWYEVGEGDGEKCQQCLNGEED